ncbi:hypothetical protein K435DRAFT_689210 [Dendrothele bispora CBS 962.96]|uniref:Uncharacterized protein n=1 Tax=Dendrothele bispora (strain CBS 962.96) TaxID=1314807 RepID=A0A4S8L5I8_DENBC|nr:hypothetical protein K435DRAFT_689210 [Dendrothele bispora CBS 962.96]
MKENIRASLDDIPRLQILGYIPSLFFHFILLSICICRYANRSARFIHAYSEGLDGPQAAWANRRYHGHRTLPPEMLRKAMEAVP